MLFNSIEYLIFLPAVLLLFSSSPARARWAVLLTASYLFYMAWVPEYLVLILISTIVDYAACRLLELARTTPARRACLGFSLIANLGLLFAFKYYGFLSDTAARLTAAFGIESRLPALDVLLPVGISFYTFQTLSYTFEVYKGAQKPERHLGRFALYVAFFPQLVAGPIERPAHLLPQLERLQGFDRGRAVSGLRLILWGLFKKVVAADRFAQIADRVYESPESYPGPLLAVGTVAFAFQILCDFSGYTDIAIGSARMFGVDLMQNFRRPYSAHSIREFWQRWHISLSTWFRDYLYIPLGGRRVSVPRHYVNLLVTFVLSGLWHGANWTFVLWGAYHAILYISGELTAPARRAAAHALALDRLPVVTRGLSIAVTFTLVCIGWVFFRATSAGDAFLILSQLTQGWYDYLSLDAADRILRELRYSTVDALIAACALGILVAGEYLRFRPDSTVSLAGVPKWVRWTAYLALAFVITRAGVQDEVNFIYFQF